MISHFIKRLFIIDLVLLVILVVLQLAVSLPGIMPFSWFCLVFFNVIGIIIFFVAARGVLHKSSHRFMAFFSGSFLLKFLFCILGVIGYVLIMKPKTILIIVPFFIFYAIFTSLEVSELMFLLKGIKKKTGQ